MAAGHARLAVGGTSGPRFCDAASPPDAPLLTSFSPTPQAVLFLLGKPIVLPVDATRFVLPEPVGTKGAMATLGLSQGLFDSALLLLQKAGALNLDITGQLVRATCCLGHVGQGHLCPSLGRPHRGQVMGRRGGWSFGGPGCCCKGYMGVERRQEGYSLGELLS